MLAMILSHLPSADILGGWATKEFWRREVMAPNCRNFPESVLEIFTCNGHSILYDAACFRGRSDNVTAMNIRRCFDQGGATSSYDAPEPLS